MADVPFAIGFCNSCSVALTENAALRKQEEGQSLLFCGEKCAQRSIRHSHASLIPHW